MTESHKASTPTLEYLLEVEARLKANEPKDEKPTDPWVSLVEMTHQNSEFVMRFVGGLGGNVQSEGSLDLDLRV
jgi:hypothetical protein